MGRGNGQSGGQVWNSAGVVRSRDGRNRGSIPVGHRIMFDSKMLPRRAAHAAGTSRVRFYEMRRGVRARGEGSQVAVALRRPRFE